MSINLQGGTVVVVGIIGRSVNFFVGIVVFVVMGVDLTDSALMVGGISIHVIAGINVCSIVHEQFQVLHVVHRGSSVNNLVPFVIKVDTG